MASTSSSITQTKATPVNLAYLETQVLPNVFKPARYIGLEQGAYRKPFEKAAVTMAFVFPDLYEIGISNYGMKLFYSLVNQQPDYMCDRGYAPAPDMKLQLTEHDIPLFALESLMPLKSFDLLAFTLQYELNYSSILGVLESAQIPFRSADRLTLDYPIMIAGGPGSGNPMPLAPFFDAFIIGDGEEVLLEILDTIKLGKAKRWTKPELLGKLAELEGVYIPGLTPKAHKRIVDIAENPIDIAPLIPAIQAVHDRVVIEARRGCDRMCRFCQPCFINLPVREQSVEQIKQSALKEIEKTGYEECSLLSLSIADYSYFKPMIMEVTEALNKEGISLSLPSQRADRFSVDVAEAVQQIRKSTLTFAPEAGTKRLRDVINKNLTDEEITNAVTSAYKTGWNKVKLYFMIGLPTETLDDLDGIVTTVKNLQHTCHQIKRDKTLSIKGQLEINVTLSNFVPKPHTPFQWFPQDTMEMLYGKIKYLKEQFRGFRGVKLNFTDPEISKLEAFISRGGVEIAEILEQAYRNGAYLDAWDDVQNFQKWFDAIEQRGAALGIEGWEQYTRERCIDPEETLPWDPIDVGLNKSWLIEEYDKARAAASTVPCFEACSTCGVCANYSTWPKFIETPANLAQYERKAKPEQGSSLSGDMATQDSTEQDRRAPKLKAVPVTKVRLKSQKRGKLKFISHLDYLRLIHRAVSRSGLPVAYSQGFNPKPRIAFSPALPLFTQSWCEFVDIDLAAPQDDKGLAQLIETLNKYLPEEASITAGKVLPMSTKSIDKTLTSTVYQASLVLDEKLLNKLNQAQTNLSSPDTNSINQATCQAPLSEYTIINRVLSVVSDLTNQLTQQTPETGSVYPNPNSFLSLKLPDTEQSLDLTPYLVYIRCLNQTDSGSQSTPTITLEFELRRLEDEPLATKPLEASQPQANQADQQVQNNQTAQDTTVLNRSDNSSDAQDAQSNPSGKPDAIALRSAPKAGSVKPAWVLNLLNQSLDLPDLKWSLTRTEIRLNPGFES